MAKEYIEREAATRILTEAAAAYGTFTTERSIYLTAREKVQNIPAADVAEVVHGSWIPLRESEITGWNPGFAGHDPIGGYKCSNCNKEAVFDCNDSFVLSDYCPNCGAKMDGGAKDAAD